MEQQNSTKGWVYVVTNPSLSGIVKVGYTTRQDVAKRLQEFDQAGLPYPYEVAYKVWVSEPRKLERRVHQFLTIEKENKEWFRCSVERAQEAIDHLVSAHKELVHKQKQYTESNNFSDLVWPGYSKEPNQPREIDAPNRDKETKETDTYKNFGCIFILSLAGLYGVVGAFFSLLFGC